MDRISQINEQLTKLLAEKDRIIDAAREMEVADFYTLLWTKDYQARLHIEYIYGMGVPKYRLTPIGGPTLHKDIVVIESQDHNDCVRFGKWGMDDYPCFYTSSATALLALLQEVHFTKILFDEDALSVLLMAKQHNEVQTV